MAYNKNDRNIELSLEFLVCCYFGKSKDLLGAAIDRAYVDMAAHTLQGFADDNIRWNCRYEASNVIFKRIKRYKSKNYEEWHSSVIKAIKACYSDPQLSEGQAQKWLNMTVKYVFVLKCVLGINYSGLSAAKTFLKKTNEKDYYPPIDSYILKGSGNYSNEPWSGFDNVRYKKIKKKMDEKEQGFVWELINWERYRNEANSNPNSGTYAKYLKTNELKYGK